MILVTGAAGKTGRAVIGALVARGAAVRALVRSEEQRSALTALGAEECVVGDMGQIEICKKAMKGVSAVYHICPNVSPHELEFSRLAIEEARTAGVSHFVYHSVLHPQVEAMPHHWLKMRVEELLFASGLPFTILQPAAYMQNILAGWSNIAEQGIYHIPYPAETRLSLVDLTDVAEAAARVLLEPSHIGAIYELVGSERLSQSEIVTILEEKLNRPVRIEQIPLEVWHEQAQKNGLSDYQIDTLKKMFRYYSVHGFYGNANVLTWLLQRPPVSFDAFVERVIQRKE